MIVQDLERLSALLKDGAIDAEEYKQAKALILSGAQKDAVAADNTRAGKNGAIPIPFEASFHGQMKMSEYWLFLLFWLPSLFLISLIDARIQSEYLGNSLAGLCLLGRCAAGFFWIWLYLSAVVRRLRDIGYHVGWTILVLVPGINIVFPLWIGLVPSKSIKLDR